MIFTSCKQAKKKQETKYQPVQIVNTLINSISTPKLKIDYLKKADLFAKEILQEDFRVHKYFTNRLKPDYLKIFESKGLDSTIAYSNINYPKKREPKHYEHFILFVLNYDSSERAKASYDRIKSDSKYGWRDLKNLTGDIKVRVKVLGSYAKYGGLIIQRDNIIFNLVETCQKSPIEGKWIDYENKFINFMIENEKQFEVLNANCGNDRFYSEMRKASR